MRRGSTSRPLGQTPTTDPTRAKNFLEWMSNNDLTGDRLLMLYYIDLYPENKLAATKSYNFTRMWKAAEVVA
jgi:hypothetical protein